MRWDLRLVLHRFAEEFQREARELYLAELLRYAVAAPHVRKGTLKEPERPAILDWMI